MSQQNANMTSQNNQSCLLLHVPAEILDRITWHLTTTELCNLRLACKSVEDALYFRFKAEFFTRKQFMVSRFSLKALVDISRSRLAEHLRHVHFGLDLLGVGSNPRRESGPAHMYQQRMVEQEALWTLGLVPKYLAEAFANLPNLESVVVRDFNSSRRTRDGPHAQWRSYGNQTLYNETTARAMPPTWDPAQLRHGSRLFTAIVHALGMAKASPKSIEVMERQGNPLYDSAFHIEEDFEDDVIPVLRSIKRLHLSVEVAAGSHLRGHEEQPYHRYNLSKFLRHCEGLEEIRINGKHSTGNDGSRSNLNYLYQWLAAEDSTPEEEAQKETDSPLAREVADDISLLRAPPKFPRLENISLGMTAVTVTQLIQFVAKFAGTLKNLELWRIQLVSEGVFLPDRTTALENRTILYVQLLQNLLDIPNLDLWHIKLGALQQKVNLVHYDQLTQQIYFKATAKTSDEDAESETARLSPALEYTGTDWRHFVANEMIPRLYLPKPRVFEVEVQTDGGDEDDEDSDNDDDNEDDENDDAEEMDQDQAEA